MPSEKTGVDRLLSKLDDEQKENLGDLMWAWKTGGDEALRAAQNRLNPRLIDPRDRNPDPGAK